MSMYNLLEYSKNYRKIIGSLYNYYRDELSDDADDNNFDNIKVANSNTFKYKNKIIGNTYNVNAGADGYDVNKTDTQEVELAIPLKYLGNFWRALNLPEPKVCQNGPFYTILVSQNGPLSMINKI